jgi:uncharacterized protein (DUF305 family)
MVPDEQMAKKFAQGMKKLQKGDLFELQLTRDMEKLFLEVNSRVG